MNLFETAAVLILIGIDIATLLLFIQHRRLERMQAQGNQSHRESDCWATLNDGLGVMSAEIADVKQTLFQTKREINLYLHHFNGLHEKLDTVLQRIGQLKTTEADKERSDQTAKAYRRDEQKKAEGK